MEIQNKNNDVLKEIKSSFQVDTVKGNLEFALQEANRICNEREYLITGPIDKIISDINLENSTLTSRKKLAKKIYFFQKKKSLKTMSSLLSFIRKRFLGEDYRVSIRLSILEQEIITSREKYKKLLSETNIARIEYKQKKRDFISKNLFI